MWPRSFANNEKSWRAAQRFEWFLYFDHVDEGPPEICSAGTAFTMLVQMLIQITTFIHYHSFRCNRTNHTRSEYAQNNRCERNDRMTQMHHSFVWQTQIRANGWSILVYSFGSEIDLNNTDRHNFTYYDFSLVERKKCSRNLSESHFRNTKIQAIERNPPHSVIA